MNTQSGSDLPAEDVSPDSVEFLAYQRLLSQVDELLGLRAALAQEAVRNTPSRAKVEKIEAELAAMRGSITWKAGRAVLAPLRLLRWAVRRSERS